MINTSQFLSLNTIIVLLFAMTACSVNQDSYARGNPCSVLYQYENRIETSPKIEKDFYAISKRFGGEGIFFLDYFKNIGIQRCGKPSNSYVQFISGILKGEPKLNYKSLVGDVDTAIHETAHWFSDRALSYDKNSANRKKIFSNPELGHTSFYTKAMGIRHLNHTRTFPAKEISEIIKNKNILKQSRFRIYIYPSNKYHVAQQYGVYGLLDEFHAYYYSVLTNNNIIKLMTQKERKIKLKGSSFMMVGSNDLALSFLQFKIYILSYFRTAEKNYPSIYKELINNRELLNILVTIYDEFEDTYKKSKKLSNETSTVGDVFAKEESDLLHESNLPENKKMLLRIRNTLDRN